MAWQGPGTETGRRGAGIASAVLGAALRRLVAVAGLVLVAAAPAAAETYVGGAITLLRTGWNADAFAVVLDTPVQNPAGCPTADGYISDASQPGFDTFYETALAAYRAGLPITVVVDDGACLGGRPRIMGINAGERLLQPETRTLVLPAVDGIQNSSVRKFQDQPVIGTFTGHGITCYGNPFDPVATFSSAGWGQVEGTGHPDGGSSPCASWVLRFGFDFDLSPIAALGSAVIVNRAILRYEERALPSEFCALVYTQGGFLIDPLPCWSSGSGAPQDKPDGCVVLRIPSVNWHTLPPAQAMPVNGLTYPKAEPRGAWDVTGLVHNRLAPGLHPTPEAGGAVSLGWGYALVGTPLDVSNLSGDDNTRCTSRISALRLEVTFTVMPDSGQSPNVR